MTEKRFFSTVPCLDFYAKFPAEFSTGYFLFFCKKSAKKVEKSHAAQGFSPVSTEFSTGDVEIVEKSKR